MKKIIFIFILCLLCLALYSNKLNLDCVTENENNITNEFQDGFYWTENNYKYYSILHFNEKLGWKNMPYSSQSLFTDNDILIDLGLKQKTLINVNNDVYVNLYIKYPNAKNNIDNPGLIVVLENNKNKIPIFYDIKKENQSNKYYPIKILDAIISQNLDKICIIYMDSYCLFHLIIIDTSKKMKIIEALPPVYSKASRQRNINSIRFWNNNTYRVKWSDGSIVFYKLFLDKEDYLKNKENFSELGQERLVYWNQEGKPINEAEKAWDYSDVEPKFNLEGWYYNDKNNKSDLSFFGDTVGDKDEINDNNTISDNVNKNKDENIESPHLFLVRIFDKCKKFFASLKNKWQV